MSTLSWRRVAFLLLLLVVASGCSAGDERPMKYLQTLPEDVLAYPGATLTCTRSKPEKRSFDDPGSATSEHCYTAAAAESAVVAWYAEELAARGWSRQDVNAGTHGAVPQWLKDFTTLQIRSVGAKTNTDPNTSRFVVTLLATGFSYDMAPVPALLAMPEAGLVFPGSTGPRDSKSGRSLSANSARGAKVERMADTSATVEEVVQFFDRELLARGWRPITPPPTDFPFGWNPKVAWQKDGVIAGLTATALKPSAATNRPVTNYWFAIAEVLGPDQTPGLPWN